MSNKDRKHPRKTPNKYLVLNISSFLLFSIILEEQTNGTTISGIFRLVTFFMAGIISLIVTSLSFNDESNNEGGKDTSSAKRNWIFPLVIVIDIVTVAVALVFSRGYSTIISFGFFQHLVNLIGFVFGAYILCYCIYKFINARCWVNDDYEKRHRNLVLLTFIIELITLLAITLGFLNNQYYLQTGLYYYFSTTAQAIAGLAGLSLAAYIFTQNRIDLVISTKSKMLDDKLKDDIEIGISTNYTKFLKFISVFVCVSIILNVLMLLKLRTSNTDEIAVDMLFFMSVTLNIAVIIGVVLLVILLADYKVATKILLKVWQDDRNNSEYTQKTITEAESNNEVGITAEEIGAVEEKNTAEEQVSIESITNNSSLDYIYSLIDKLYKENSGSLKFKGNHIAELRWLVSSRKIRDKDLYNDLYYIFGIPILGYDIDHEKIENVKKKLEKMLDDE